MFVGLSAFHTLGGCGTRGLRMGLFWTPRGHLEFLDVGGWLFHVDMALHAESNFLAGAGQKLSDVPRVFLFGAPAYPDDLLGGCAGIGAVSLLAALETTRVLHMLNASRYAQRPSTFRDLVSA